MKSIDRRKLLIASGAGLAGMRFGPAGAAEAANPITLGLVTPMSGPQEQIGSLVKWGAEIAVKQINDDGGVMGRPLVLEERDDKVTSSITTTVTRELLAKGVNLQFGEIASGPALALGPILAQENGMHLTCGAISDKQTHENYNEHLFRPGLGPVMAGHGPALLAAQRYPEVLSWGAILPDSESGRTLWSIFVDGLLTYYPKFTGKTPEIRQPVLTPYGGTDMRTQINAAMRLNTAGLFNAVYGGDAVTLINQARPYGLFARSKCYIDAAADLIIAQALKSQMVPYWTLAHWNADVWSGNAMSQRLVKDYKALHQGEPIGYLSEGHSCVYAYKAAIEKAGSTETKPVMDAMKTLSWETVTGRRVMRPEDNQAICTMTMMYVTGSNDAPGYKVSDGVMYPGADLLEPPTPGKPLQLKSP